MTLQELKKIIESLNTQNYNDYEIKFYHQTQDGKEIVMPIKAVGLSAEKEILLSTKCPLCDD